MDNGQVDRFLQRRPKGFWKGKVPTQEKPSKEECYTKVMTTILRGYVESVSQLIWKAPLCVTQYVMTAKREVHINMLTMTFSEADYRGVKDGPLVMELKIANALMILRILVNTGTSGFFFLVKVR